MVTCPKCDGLGKINFYSHVQGGVCFKCAGSGQVKEVKAKKTTSKKTTTKKCQVDWDTIEISPVGYKSIFEQYYLLISREGDINVPACSYYGQTEESVTAWYNLHQYGKIAGWKWVKAEVKNPLEVENIADYVK